MGFAPEAVDLIARLVRWHLVLAETATTRDPDDPATVELITEARRDRRGARPAARALRGGRQGDLAEGLVRRGAPA